MGESLIPDVPSLCSLHFRTKINFVTLTMIDSLLTNYDVELLWQLIYNMATFV